MALQNIHGRVAFVFDEPNFDVDQIIGVKNIKLQDLDALSTLAMSAFDPGFRDVIRRGDILVGAENFGYGHPHPPPMRVMRHLGVSCVIAESFAPTYWSNEISAGFPQVSCPGIIACTNRWDEFEVNWISGLVINHTQGRSLSFEPFTARDWAVLNAGGFVSWLKGEAVPEAPVAALVRR